MAPAVRRFVIPALLALSLSAVLLALPAAQARASTGQVSIFQDDPRLDADPAGTLARMRILGAQLVRRVASTPPTLRPIRRRSGSCGTKSSPTRRRTGSRSIST